MINQKQNPKTGKFTSTLDRTAIYRDILNAPVSMTRRQLLGHVCLKYDVSAVTASKLIREAIGSIGQPEENS